MKQLYIDIFENVKGVKAFFSTKYGACEGSPYYHEETLKQLGLSDMQLIQPQQVHEAHIQVISERGTEPVVLPQTDGAITDQKDVLLTTVHADCLPVWFYDKENHAIGLVHAGWRGTLAGIAPKAVKLMEETYGSDPAGIMVYIGPGISKCCFETGPEVIEAFRKEWKFADEYAEPVGARHQCGCGQSAESDKYYIDLKGINEEELLRAGVLKDNITISSHCTCCEPETFASYRREGGTYMRMGAGICLAY